MIYDCIVLEITWPQKLYKLVARKGYYIIESHVSEEKYSETQQLFLYHWQLTRETPARVGRIMKYRCVGRYNIETELLEK